MAHQEQSRDGAPQEDRGRPGPNAQPDLVAPGAGLSDRNGPSDPDNRKQ